MQLVPPVWHSIVPIPILCTHNQIDAASQASSRPARQRERERERETERVLGQGIAERRG